VPDIVKLTSREFIEKIDNSMEWHIRASEPEEAIQLVVDADEDVYESPNMIRMPDAEYDWFVMEMVRILSGGKKT
jgi:hypothetical protein